MNTNSGFDGSTLILYDSEEIAQAQSVMETYAAALRGISSQSEFDEYIADFSSDMDYSDITKPQFSDDTGIERISGYEDSVKSFLYCRAMESMPQYEYLYDETTTEDGKACTAQTLNVTDSTGSRGSRFTSISFRNQSTPNDETPPMTKSAPETASLYSSI